jgi:hypothetical protein
MQQLLNYLFHYSSPAQYFKSLQSTTVDLLDEAPSARGPPRDLHHHLQYSQKPSLMNWAEEF